MDVVILLLLLKERPYTIDCNQHFKTSLESTQINIIERVCKRLKWSFSLLALGCSHPHELVAIEFFIDTQVFVPIEKKSVA